MAVAWSHSLPVPDMKRRMHFTLSTLSITLSRSHSSSKSFNHSAAFCRPLKLVRLIFFSMSLRSVFFSAISPFASPFDIFSSSFAIASFNFESSDFIGVLGASLLASFSNSFAIESFSFAPSDFDASTGCTSSKYVSRKTPSPSSSKYSLAISAGNVTFRLRSQLMPTMPDFTLLIEKSSW